jgi:hypothetical protein
MTSNPTVNTGPMAMTTMTPPPASTGAAGAPSTAQPGSSASAGSSAPSTSNEDNCHPQTSLARALDDAPDNVLFVMDRSADMALDYQGTPRWQVAGQSLVQALTPLTATKLQVGGVFYPSAQSCSLPSWLCPSAQPQPMSTTCGVNDMTSADQLEFAPVPNAISALTGSAALNQAISGIGVPLSESVASANHVFAARTPSGKTSVVLLVDAAPSCGWDQNQSAKTISTWRSEHQIDTHVIALPGANPQSLEHFDALAMAGGQQRAVAPATTDALRSAIQAVVVGSLSQCNLQLEPPVSDAAAAHVIVGSQGMLQEIPRTSAAGETLWSISSDGTQLLLQGAACSALQAGAYDSLQVDVGCSRYPRAQL